MNVLAILKRTLSSEKLSSEGERALYVHRPLRNGSEILAWAKSQGFKHGLDPSDLHVIICYSKNPFSPTLEPVKTGLKVEAGKRELKVFGEDAIVLTFTSAMLQKRHEEFRADGASFDFPSYQPHVTLTYKSSDVDLAKVAPYDGPLIFGPEVWGEVKAGWGDEVKEPVIKRLGGLVIKYDPNQARDENGRWTDTGALSSAAAPDPSEYTTNEKVYAQYAGYRDQMQEMFRKKDVRALEKFQFGTGRAISKAFENYRLELLRELRAPKEPRLGVTGASRGAFEVDQFGRYTPIKIEQAPHSASHGFQDPRDRNSINVMWSTIPPDHRDVMQEALGLLNYADASRAAMSQGNLPPGTPAAGQYQPALQRVVTSTNSALFYHETGHALDNALHRQAVDDGDPLPRLTSAALTTLDGHGYAHWNGYSSSRPFSQAWSDDVAQSRTGAGATLSPRGAPTALDRYMNRPVEVFAELYSYESLRRHMGPFATEHYLGQNRRMRAIVKAYPKTLAHMRETLFA